MKSDKIFENKMIRFIIFLKKSWWKEINKFNWKSLVKIKILVIIKLKDI